MKTRWIYGISTGLFALAMSASGIIELMRSPEMVAGFQQLGYPLYLMTLLGVAKLLGAAALVYPRWRTLTEWAYAGFTFDLLGASASHAFSGDPAAKVIAPLIFLGLMALSYTLFRQRQALPSASESLSLRHA